MGERVGGRGESWGGTRHDVRRNESLSATYWPLFHAVEQAYRERLSRFPHNDGFRPPFKNRNKKQLAAGETLVQRKMWPLISPVSMENDLPAFKCKHAANIACSSSNTSRGEVTSRPASWHRGHMLLFSNGSENSYWRLPRVSTSLRANPSPRPLSKPRGQY